MADAALYVENMDVNFDKMLGRIKTALDGNNLQELFDKIAQIQEPTIVTGVGGSSVVGKYFAKVLNQKNKIIATFCFPRDLKFMDLSGYKNVISVSYSGKNVGVDASFDNDLNKYLFSGSNKEGVHSLQYKVMDEEYSFVSMAGTFIPLSILLMYYKHDFSIIEDIFSKRYNYDLDDSLVYEVFTSEKSCTAAMMLDSTMVEGSLAAPVFHEKYNYCHGRTLFNDCYHNPLIYFEDESVLDTMLQNDVLKTYRKVITMKGKYGDSVMDDYYWTYLCLNLCYCLSAKQNKDMSIKNVPEVSEIVYRYSGKM